MITTRLESINSCILSKSLMTTDFHSKLLNVVWGILDGALMNTRSYVVLAAFKQCSISSAILFASMDAPRRPRLVKPTAYSPFFPFHPFGKSFRGNPSFSQNISLSCSQQIFQNPNHCTLIALPFHSY